MVGSLLFWLAQYVLGGVAGRTMHYGGNLLIHINPIERNHTMIVGKILKTGEKEIVLYSTDYHRAVAYLKIDGSGRVTVEEYTVNGWLVVDEQKKTAQEINLLLVRECAKHGNNLIKGDD